MPCLDPLTSSSPDACPTRVEFWPGRTPALEVVFGLGDYLTVLRAVDALAEARADSPVVSAAAAMRASMLGDIAALTPVHVDRAAPLGPQLDALAAALREAAAWSPRDVELVTTRRLALLAGPRRPHDMAVLTAALLLRGAADPEALVLLEELERAIDDDAVAVAARRHDEARTHDERVRRLAAAARAARAEGVPGRLFWNPDTRTAFWALGAGANGPRGAAHQLLGAVDGVEVVVVRSVDAPSPDAAHDEDPSWVRVDGDA